MGASDSRLITKSGLEEIALSFNVDEALLSNDLLQEEKGDDEDAEDHSSFELSSVEKHEELDINIARRARHVLLCTALGDSLGLPCEGRPSRETAKWWAKVERQAANNWNSLGEQCALPLGQVSCCKVDLVFFLFFF